MVKKKNILFSFGVIIFIALAISFSSILPFKYNKPITTASVQIASTFTEDDVSYVDDLKSKASYPIENVTYSAFVHSAVFWYNGSGLVCYVNFTSLLDINIDSSYSIHPFNVDTGEIYLSTAGYINDYQSVYFVYSNGICADDWSSLGVYLHNGVSDYFFNSTERYYESLGYSNGFDNGKEESNAEMYNKGYDVGLNEGFHNGYGVGVNDSNQYTFYNLFGAVLDAPVKVFSDLFNFELLGVNLLGLITGLFTLAVVIVIIKKVMGGK